MIKGFFDQNRFLSNFWKADVFYDGFLYPSVENAYQASKTMDASIRKNFCNVESNIAKNMGKGVQLRYNWNEIRVPIMKDLVLKKFLDPTLRAKLLATGNVPLVEYNYWNDTFWGVCSKTNQGENNLGKILMLVRKTLK